MEHEVLVPLSPQALRRSLDRPELLAVCLPGFTVDEEGGGPLAGRLKLRVGSSSITYRGELRRLAGAPGEYVFALDGRQSVGAGDIAGTVRIVIGAEGPDSRMTFLTSLQGKGRIEELPAPALETAGRRLLDRFCVELSALAEEYLDATAPEHEPEPEPLLTDSAPELDIDFAAEAPEAAEAADADTGADADAAESADAADPFEALGPLEEALVGEPARRSIVGRSAEEVDHAPPRGRYAPSLPPRSARSRASARWGAPERGMGEPPYVAETDRPRTPWVVGGVALVGGAVILVRALRRSR